MAKKARGLRSAIEAEDVSLICALIAESADLTKIGRSDGLTPLAHAVEKQNLAIVAALLEAGADPDNGGIEVPLALAAGGSVEILRALLAAGANPNRPGEEGGTPLMSASSAEAVAVLIAAGATPTATDEGDTTALGYAASRGDPAVFEALAPYFDADAVAAARLALAEGVRQRARENDVAGKNFVLAAQAGKLDAVLAAIATGVDIEARIGCGESALHRAVYFGNVEVVAALLEAGADPHARSDSGESPLDMAVRARRDEVARMLLAAKPGLPPREGE